MVTSLAAAMLLIGLMGLPAEAKVPKVDTVSGRIVFVDSVTETSITARFQSANLKDAGGTAIPNGYVTIWIGDADPVTYEPWFEQWQTSDGIQHVDLFTHTATEYLMFTVSNYPDRRIATFERYLTESWTALEQYWGPITQGSYTLKLAKLDLGA